MIDIPLIEELREIRRCLAEQYGNDVQRYAAMLADVSRTLPGVYVVKPLLPPSQGHAPQPESSLPLETAASPTL